MLLLNFFYGKKKMIVPIMLVLSVFILLMLPNLLKLGGYLKYDLLYNKESLHLSLAFADPTVKKLASDPENRLILTVRVNDFEGKPVSDALVNFTVSGTGSVVPEKLRTDRQGYGITTFIPSAGSKSGDNTAEEKVHITAAITGSTVQTSVPLQLVDVPVVFIHGYQSTSDIFQNFREYLLSTGFPVSSFNYPSEQGIAAGSGYLDQFLTEEKENMLASGLKTERFDLIAHSMGGLVARYYTSGKQYMAKNDVRKIIFLSVPQKGSHLAALGAALFDDPGIKDLIPESSLFTTVFPGMPNHGLNRTIQAGSLLGQYDEVVNEENASLKDWGIETEIFNVGENNLTVEKILNGSIMESANHRAVLNNRKVFERVEEMLRSELTYPQKKQR